MSNIIIAKTFKKDFKKIYKNETDLNKFAIKISKTKLLNLEKPFEKFKFSFKLIDVRGILISEVENFYIPIFIVKKSDKNYWMNLILNPKIEKILEIKSKKIEKDIENDDFEIL